MPSASPFAVDAWLAVRRSTGHERTGLRDVPTAMGCADKHRCVAARVTGRYCSVCCVPAAAMDAATRLSMLPTVVRTTATPGENEQLHQMGWLRSMAHGVQECGSTQQRWFGWLWLASTFKQGERDKVLLHCCIPGAMLGIVNSIVTRRFRLRQKLMGPYAPLNVP